MNLLWMEPSQLTALPVLSLQCSWNASNSLPTTIWLSGGFKLCAQLCFHFHGQRRSLPSDIQAKQPHLPNIREGAGWFLRNDLTRRLTTTCGKWNRKKASEENWNGCVVTAVRLLSSINGGNYWSVITVTDGSNVWSQMHCSSLSLLHLVPYSSISLFGRHYHSTALSSEIAKL